MVSKNYAGALVLSGLLGCSTPIESMGYVESPPASVDEESAMGYVLGLSSHSVNPFHGKRVDLLYSTNDGPVLGREFYTGGRPVNSGLLNFVRDELIERKAYVLEQGAFRGNYETLISASRMPNMNPADFIVIADENPKLPEDLKNVYFVEKNGDKYKIVEANKR